MRYKSQENVVFIAIHPPTYRGGGFLAHGVLKRKRHNNAAFKKNEVVVKKLTYKLVRCNKKCKSDRCRKQSNRKVAVHNYKSRKRYHNKRRTRKLLL